MNNIGIIYICTGKYKIFLKKYIETCEKYFLPNCHKKYFIFCDTAIDEIINSFNVNYEYIFQEKLPFPLPTLKRFHMINSIKHRYENIDYLFFTNANMEFVDTIITEEILPTEENNFLVSVEHPGYFNNINNVDSYPYERDLKSSACIQYGYGKKYYQGCFFGGRKKEFLAMSDELQNNIEYDLSINFMAKWHDESHTNKYFAHTPPKTISPSYAYPETWDLNIPKKIIQIDKNKYGGHEEMRK